MDGESLTMSIFAASRPLFDSEHYDDSFNPTSGRKQIELGGGGREAVQFTCNDSQSLIANDPVRK